MVKKEESFDRKIIHPISLSLFLSLSLPSSPSLPFSLTFAWFSRLRRKPLPTMRAQHALTRIHAHTHTHAHARAHAHALTLTSVHASNLKGLHVVEGEGAVQWASGEKILTFCCEKKMIDNIVTNGLNCRQIFVFNRI